MATKTRDLIQGAPKSSARLRLIALSPKINRSQLSLEKQTELANDRVRQEGGKGVTFWEAMAQLAQGNISKGILDAGGKRTKGTLLTS